MAMHFSHGTCLYLMHHVTTRFLTHQNKNTPAWKSPSFTLTNIKIYVVCQLSCQLVWCRLKCYRLTKLYADPEYMSKWKLVRKSLEKEETAQWLREITTLIPVTEPSHRESQRGTHQSDHPNKSEKCALNLSPLITPPTRKRAATCITGHSAESTRSLQHNRGLVLWQQWIEVRPVPCSWERFLSCRALDGAPVHCQDKEGGKESRCQQLSTLPQQHTARYCESALKSN